MSGIQPFMGRILLLAAGTLFLVSAARTAETASVEVRKVSGLIDASGNGAHIISQDGAHSIPLKTGSLWLYGDTFYGAGKIQGGVSNASAWSEDSDASDGLSLVARAGPDGNPIPALEYQASEDRESLRLWPGHGISLDGRIYVYYSVTKVGQGGPLDLTHVAQGLAVSTGPASPFVRLKSPGRLVFWGAHEPSFGVAVYGGQDGYVYVYGRSETPPSGFMLARVRPEVIERPEGYEYACVREGRARWKRDIRRACPLFEEGPPEASVSFHPFIGQYLMLYSRFLEQDVVVRLANQPWGPWSEPIRIYECTRGENAPQGVSCYAGKEHPQYARVRGNTIYFTMVDGRVFGGRPEIFEVKLQPE